MTEFFKEEDLKNIGEIKKVDNSLVNKKKKKSKRDIGLYIQQGHPHPNCSKNCFGDITDQFYPYVTIIGTDDNGVPIHLTIPYKEIVKICGSQIAHESRIDFLYKRANYAEKVLAAIITEMCLNLHKYKGTLGHNVKLKKTDFQEVYRIFHGPNLGYKEKFIDIDLKPDYDPLFNNGSENAK